MTTTPSPERRPRRSELHRQTGTAPSPELLQRAGQPASPYAAPRPAEAPAPRPRRTAPPEPAPARPAPRRTVPTWMIAALCGLTALVLVLLLSQHLLTASIDECYRQREEAYQRVVDNHPLRYREAIERCARENNLQPAFVAAIVLNESSFRPQAESNVGARGLMQLMPDTAQWIAGKLDEADYSFDRMYDGETNIRFGTWYLGYLARLFRGDPATVASAYHAGQTTVTQWISDPALSEDGVLNLSALKDGPTKSYARRVTQDYAVYQALYYSPDPSAADAAGAAVLPVPVP